MRFKFLLLSLLAIQGCKSPDIQEAEIYSTSEQAQWQRSPVQVQSQTDVGADVIVSA